MGRCSGAPSGFVKVLDTRRAFRGCTGLRIDVVTDVSNTAKLEAEQIGCSEAKEEVSTQLFC